MRRALALVTFVVACHASGPLAPSAVAETPAPKDVEALFHDALQLRKNGDDAGAKAKLDLVLKAEPTFALAALERADALVALGHASEAVGDAELAVKSLPNNPRAWAVQGRVFEDEGQVDQAIAAYRKSTGIRDDPAVRRRIASLDQRAGRLPLAAREWEALRDAKPDDVAIHLELSTLYEQLDRPASAEEEYRALVRLAPENALFHQRFAAFLDRQGKSREARGERARAEALLPKPDAPRDFRPLPPSRR